MNDKEADKFIENMNAVRRMINVLQRQNAVMKFDDFEFLYDKHMKELNFGVPAIALDLDIVKNAYYAFYAIFVGMEACSKKKDDAPSSNKNRGEAKLRLVK
jgi:hypothetical protein